MTDHANELRRYSRKIGHPAGDVPSVMLAAAEEIERLAARLEATESEALEQARLNGTGSEREAAIMAKLEAAEKSDAESLAMYRKARDERDALRVELNEIRYGTAVAHDTIKALNARIEAAEKERDWHAERCEDAMNECARLRNKVEQMEKQEPARLVTPTAYRWRYRGAIKWQYGELTEETVRLAKEHNHEVQPLYALPGAKGE